MKNIRIIGRTEGGETWTKGIESIFQKIIKENVSTLKKEMIIKVKEAYRTPDRLNQKVP